MACATGATRATTVSWLTRRFLLIEVPLPQRSLLAFDQQQRLPRRIRETPSPGRWSCPPQPSAAMTDHHHEAVAALGPYVDTWSILNEPDLNLMAGDCTPTQQDRMLTTRAVKTHRVKRYQFIRVTPRSKATGVRYRRVVRVVRVAGKHKRVARYISTARKRGRYVRRAFFYTRAGMPEEPISIEFACEKATAGQTYTRILAATAPVLRAADPTARIVGWRAQPLPGRLRLCASSRLVTRRRRRDPPVLRAPVLSRERRAQRSRAATAGARVGIRRSALRTQWHRADPPCMEAGGVI